MKTNPLTLFCLVSYLHDLISSVQADFEFRYRPEMRWYKDVLFPQAGPAGSLAMVWRSWMKLQQRINMAAIAAQRN